MLDELQVVTARRPHEPEVVPLVADRTAVFGGEGLRYQLLDRLGVGESGCVQGRMDDLLVECRHEDLLVCLDW
ncbi:hypothetical protein [Streptomyces sp. NPDC001893]|uniref:hypothetical protein n=1 Tax=Streptomyces sp. NPDC001893 TaxID=3154530 RepID=UPI00331801FA